MKQYSTSSGDDVVYLRHSNSGAAEGFATSSAASSSIASIVKNLVILAPEADPVPAPERTIPSPDEKSKKDEYQL